HRHLHYAGQLLPVPVRDGAKAMSVAEVRPVVVKVRLSWEDMTYAAHVGVRRRVESLRGPFTPQHGAPQFSPHFWSQDIDCAAAELAVACYLDQPWTGEASRAHCDVGRDIQVRHTWHPSGCLIVREHDPWGRYVLVVGHDGSYDLMGWIEHSATRRA